jgi:hypothetical protein
VAALLPQYSSVKIIQLLRPPEHYNDWKINQRPPAVGDEGIIVEIYQNGPDVLYVVESVAADARAIWLADLKREELAPAEPAQ